MIHYENFSLAEKIKTQGIIITEELFNVFIVIAEMYDKEKILSKYRYLNYIDESAKIMNLESLFYTFGQKRFFEFLKNPDIRNSEEYVEFVETFHTFAFNFANEQYVIVSEEYRESEEEKSVIGYELENSPDYPDIDLQIAFTYMLNMMNNGTSYSGLKDGKIHQGPSIKYNFYLVPASLFSKEERKEKGWKESN